MADFYSELATMARNLLAPTSAGGLGQGSIAIVRTVRGTPDPLEPWKPVPDVVTKTPIRGAAKGVNQRLVGTEVGGTIIVATDIEVISEAVNINRAAGEVLHLDGKPVSIISVSNIPPVGIAAATRFIVR